MRRTIIVTRETTESVQLTVDGTGVMDCEERALAMSRLPNTLWAQDDTPNASKDHYITLSEELDDSDPLAGMTQQKWDALGVKGRHAIVDVSGFHPKLVDHIGKKVRVTPSRGEGRLSTFVVGSTTGWRPVLMALQGNRSDGSSDLISVNEKFDRIEVLS